MKKLLTILFAVALGLNLSAQVPDYVPTDGLVAWYPFNGNANDESGAGLHASPEEVDLVEDRFSTSNRAYQFSGEENSFIVLPDMPSPQEFTLSAWCKKEVDSNLDSWIYGDWQGSAPVFGEGVQYQGGIGLVVRTDNLIYAHIDSDETDGPNNSVTNGYSSSSDSIGIGTWEHVIVRRSNGQTSFWLNGELSETIFDYSENPTDREFSARIGASAIDSQKFQGIIDDFGFWSRALTGEEINHLFNWSPVLGCTDPAACNFDSEATSDDGSCIPSGCMETDACNYNALAECEGEACDYTCCPGPGCCSAGMYWDYDLEQCLNYETCQEDLDGDGVIGINDLMQLLSSFGTMCPIWMCGNTVNYHGYDYATVQIGEQCWFAENLRTTYYANGDSLQGELSDSEWSNSAAGAQAINNNDASNLTDYGRLYNGHAVVDSRGLCPNGWNVPTDGEFIMLEMELGMSESEANSDGWRGTDQGTQMKASLEDSPAWNGTNSRGFTGLPGGKRSNTGNFDPSGTVGYWWSSTQIGGQAWFRQLQSGRSNIDRAYPDLRYGFSIRCLKDTEE